MTFDTVRHFITVEMCYLKYACLKIRQATFKSSDCSDRYRRKQRRVYYIAPPLWACLESRCGLSFTTLRGAVTWHAIYVHSDKGDRRFGHEDGGGSVRTRSSVGTRRLVNFKSKVWARNKQSRHFS